LLYITGYLEKYIKDFKALVNSSTITQGQIYDYYKRFYKIGIKCKDNGNIIEKALIFKFLYRLPQNLRIKAIKFGAKIKKFDIDNIKTFKEIYRDIKNSYAVLRDIDNLV
jgi:hypothetical protein